MDECFLNLLSHVSILRVRRPIILASQLATSGTLDIEPSNAKRESILGMAVSGVRNLLTVSNV